VSQSLSRWQAALLGLVVLAALGLGGYGVARIADRQGFWADTFEVTVGFPEAHDVTPGTPVRIRGVEAGTVVAIDYPPDDRPGTEVTLRLELNAKYAGRLYADASARIVSSGLLGSKVVAVSPGSPESGPLASGRLRGLKPFNLDEAAAEFRDTAQEVKALVKEATGTAAEAKQLLREVRESEGTVARLLNDDDLYRDLKEIAADAKGLLRRADGAVGKVESEMANLKGFVSDGRETLRSVKQGTDAIGRMPVIRGYVEDAAAILVRPAHHRERKAYATKDLFEPGTAILTDTGRYHLAAVVDWLKGVRDKRPDVVVVSFCDPDDRTQTAASAAELTKKQSEAVIEFLKAHGVHKLGWTTRRKMTPLGMGMHPSPVVEQEPLPASNVQVLLFTPQ
jgi:phospholipid/cholesterol/gamma-HCH transport system substrate-binding protein